MNTNRRILFALVIFTWTLSWSAQASVTKVGNGDDGSDLEALTPITAGPIFEARKLALEKLKLLNVAGVPGLSQLTPELERTDLMMAAKDVGVTTENPAALEVSSEKQMIYARTFAEPHAATRFFPIAKTLSNEQLISLHIHEALHRSLPAQMRENEDIVSHITMAITSPGASFDRVSHVASIYIKPQVAAEHYTASVTVKAPTPRREVEQTRTQVGITALHFVEFKDYYSSPDNRMLYGLNLLTSAGGVKHIGSLAFEPVFRGRLNWVSQYGQTEEFAFAPASFEFQGRMPMDYNQFVAPFFRYTLASLNEYERQPGERDVTTLGFNYQDYRGLTYTESSLAYSPPGSSKSERNAEYSAIWSLSGKYGFQKKGFRAAGIGEFHSIEKAKFSSWQEYHHEPGNYFLSNEEYRSERFLLAGLELGYVTDRVQILAHYKEVLNKTTATLDILGDMVDRGAERGSVGVSVAMKF